jgi:putative ABC transport system permease protein
MKDFWRLFWRLNGRDLLRNKLRTVLTVLGITLGVAILLAIHLANGTALNRFRESIDLVSGRSNLQIRATDQPTFPYGSVNGLQALALTNASFTPVLEEVAVWPAAPHDVLQIVGVDMLADRAFHSYEWRFEGKPKDPFEIFRPGQVYIGERLARAKGLRVGASFELMINDSRQRLVVSGILAAQGLGKAYSGNIILMDIGAAQALFRLPGRISHVDLIVPESALEDVQFSLKHSLPGSLVAEKPARRGERVEQMLRSYRSNLTALSFIALLVGMFLIYNTMSVTVVRRRPEIGILRALGASRKLIFGLFMTEAACLGLTGTLLGLGLGVLLGGGAVQAVSQTVQMLYTGQPVTGLEVSPEVLGMAFLLGVGLTLLAALPPVMEAASVQAAEATRRATYESRVRRLSPQLALLGLALLGLSWPVSQQPPIFDFPVLGYLATLLMIFGTAATIPWTVHRGLPTLIPLLKPLGIEGKLAVLSLRGALGRTAVAVASLMIALGMLVSLTVMIASFRQTVVAWVNQSLQADLWIQPAARTVSRFSGNIDSALPGAIARLPGVQTVDPFVEFPFEFRGKLTNLAAGSMDTLARREDLRFVDGRDARPILSRLKREAGLLATESFGRRYNVKAGDILTLTTPTGVHRLRLEGLYYDYSSERGYLVMPRWLYQRLYGNDAVTSIAVWLQPDEDEEAARQRIYRLLGPKASLTIRTNRELRHEVLRIFDNTFAITYALQGIALTVAILAIMNTLFTLVLEGRRDFAILKYLGASATRIRKLVLIQAGLLGLLGNLFGMSLGAALSYVLIYVINRQSFGWTVQVHIPWDFIVGTFVTVLLVAVFSGLAPARLATRTLAPEALRQE